MPLLIANVTPTSDTFQSWVDKTNQIADAMSTVVLTSAANTIGGQNSANVNLEGIFAANTIAATTQLRGGSVSDSANLTITSNAHFSGANVSTDTTYLNLQTTTAIVNANTITVSGTTANISSNLFVKGTSLTVTSAGRVGINTSSTDAALSVVGGANVSANVWVGGQTTLASNVAIGGTGTISRASAPTTGYLAFGNTGTRSIGYDGTVYVFANTANVSMGGTILTANAVVSGSANVGGSLGVTGDATFSANVSASRLTLSNALVIGSGGTGATTAAGARSNLGLGSIAVLNSITSSQFTGTTTLSILDSAGSTLKTLYASST